MYLGISGETLRLGYREFAEDHIRPAFSQELTVPLKTLPAETTVKGVVFKIAAVNNGAITYSIH